VSPSILGAPGDVDGEVSTDTGSREAVRV